MPESVIVTRKWRAKKASLDRHVIDNLVKSEQLKLLRILPLLDSEKCFALKSGMAINLFYRELPSLSYQK